MKIIDYWPIVIVRLCLSTIEQLQNVWKSIREEGQGGRKGGQDALYRLSQGKNVQ